MVRLGYYTGKLYEEGTDVSTIRECCAVLNFKPPVYDDEELVVLKRTELKKRCVGCFECQEAKNDLNLE